MKKRLSRGWTPQEDQLLINLVEKHSNSKKSWVSFSKVLFDKTGRQRTGKQCRQRWQHQLNPSINRQSWSQAQSTKLFELQKVLGNKWSSIAQHLPGRTDNIVKNYFYAYVRKSITKINLVVQRLRREKIYPQMRPFDPQFVSKLIIVNDGDYNRKIKLNSHNLQKTARNIFNKIIALGQNLEQYCLAGSCLHELIEQMHLFRLNSKKRKQSKKCKQQRFKFQEQNYSANSYPIAAETQSILSQEQIKISSPVVTSVEFFKKIQISQIQGQQSSNFQQKIKQQDLKLSQASNEMKQVNKQKIINFQQQEYFHLKASQQKINQELQVNINKSFSYIFDCFPQSSLRCIYAVQSEDYQFASNNDVLYHDEMERNQLDNFDIISRKNNYSFDELFDCNEIQRL